MEKSTTPTDPVPTPGVENSRPALDTAVVIASEQVLTLRMLREENLRLWSALDAILEILMNVKDSK